MATLREKQKSSCERKERRTSDGREKEQANRQVMMTMKEAKEKLTDEQFITFNNHRQYELQDFSNRFCEKAGSYAMEVSTETLKTVVNSTNNTSADINMNGDKQKEETSFKYLGETLPKDGITMETEAMARRNM
ncbi:hypothetical protein DPMN_042392 [Dreissena polymorpha]|uniref:Uncharacterized protein n=1 Tax=Dreissena polymorpha TaxID=45954 RepID=A0A9D4HWV6_DREPO|nr:hypothetical protein DPMN_042392 [Dreissena polymorpha]